MTELGGGGPPVRVFTTTTVFNGLKLEKHNKDRYGFYQVTRNGLRKRETRGRTETGSLLDVTKRVQAGCTESFDKRPKERRKGPALAPA